MFVARAAALPLTFSVALLGPVRRGLIYLLEVTSRMLGRFRSDPSTRREFLALIGSPSSSSGFDGG